MATQNITTAQYHEWVNDFEEAFEIEDTSTIKVDEVNSVMHWLYNPEGSTFDMTLDFNEMLVTVRYSDPEDNTEIYTDNYHIKSLADVSQLIHSIANVTFWGNSEGEDFLKQCEAK